LASIREAEALIWMRERAIGFGFAAASRSPLGAFPIANLATGKNSFAFRWSASLSSTSITEVICVPRSQKIRFDLAAFLAMADQGLAGFMLRAIEGDFRPGENFGERLPPPA
jgi:hypothetical protein